MSEKIYRRPGKLIFSLENFNLQTNLISLSLSDLKHKYFTVPPPFPHGGSRDELEHTTCSFLSNDILFKTGSYNGLFFITATDIYSGVVYYSNMMHLDKKQDIANTPFFKDAKYNEPAKEVKYKLYKYLDWPSISVNYAGDGRFDIEVSSLYTGANWAQISLSVITSFAGTYAINSIPDVWGYSIFYFHADKTLAIKNTINLGTGNFTASGDSSLFSTDSWDNKLKQVNDFVKKNAEVKPAPGTLIAGEKVYVYWIDAQEGKLLVYKF